MKSVLITGITGFVGTSLVEHFNKNATVSLLGSTRDIAKAEKSFHGKAVKFLSGLSATKFDQHKVDTIIHLAGIAHDLSGKYKPDDYMEVNFHQTVKLYNEFCRSDVKKFVFVSSIKAVVDHSEEVIDEKTTPAPISPYGKSKRKAEQYLLENQVAGKELFILQPCMIHGPGNKGNLNLLYNFIKKGIPYPLGAFENKRSFLSIDNFNFIIDKILKGRIVPDVYILGDSETASTNDLIELIGKQLGRKVVVLKLPVVIVRAIAEIGSVLNVAFNKSSLQKLTESMIVSNKKLLKNLNETLPVHAKAGLVKTIKSFNE